MNDLKLGLSVAIEGVRNPMVFLQKNCDYNTKRSHERSTGRRRKGEEVTEVHIDSFGNFIFISPFLVR